MRTIGLLFLIVYCLLLMFHDLAGNDLWTSHEARAAQNAQRMLDEGDWWLPRLYDGQVELQKPPGFYWLVALVGETRGSVDRLAVRLPSAIAGIAVVLMVWRFLTADGRPLAGFFAGMMIVSAVHFTSSARVGRIDMMLTAVTTAALLLLHRPTWPRAAAAGVALAAGILLKGPIAIVLPMFVQMLRSVHARWQVQPLGRAFLVRSAFAGLLGLLFAMPIFVAIDRATQGEFFRVFIWYHNVDRALGDAPALSSYPFWYYIPRLAIDLLPWTPAFLAALLLFSYRSAFRVDRIAYWGLLWGVGMVFLLSLAKFKRADYLLPAYPGLAIFVGCVGERWYRETSIRLRRAASIMTVLGAVGCIAGWAYVRTVVDPPLAASRDQDEFAHHIREHAPHPQEVLLFRVESHLLAYHLGRPICTLIEWHDLNRWVAQPGTHYFVTRAEFVAECLQYVHTRQIEVVAASEQFTAARPARPLVLMRTRN